MKKILELKTGNKILLGLIWVALIILLTSINVNTHAPKEKEIIYVEKIGYIEDYNSYKIKDNIITIHFDYGDRRYVNYKCRIFPKKDFKYLGYPTSKTLSDDTMFIDGKILHGKYNVKKSTMSILIVECDGYEYKFLNYGNDMRIRTSQFPLIETEG